MFASQGWNMAMDFVILLSPLYILRHSNAPLKQRVLLGVVLAFGGVYVSSLSPVDAPFSHLPYLILVSRACIISVIRLHTLYPSGTSADPTWDKVPSAIYGIVEINVGISCASVVTLRPLVHGLRGALSDKGDASRETVTEVPQDPVRRRFSDDCVLMAGGTTRAGSEGHWQDMDLELGGRVHNDSDLSVAGSKRGKLGQGVEGAS
jgi:hypothetical protein